jgi:cell division protein ZapA
MKDKVINSTIEILGKYYSVRCTEEELPSLQEAALYLNKKMQEVQESGKAINLERIAIISALNITHQYLQMDQHKSGLVSQINQRIAQLQHKLEHALEPKVQTELIYSIE